VPEDIFTGQVAEGYDRVSADMYDPAVLEPAVSFLADAARDASRGWSCGSGGRTGIGRRSRARAGSTSSCGATDVARCSETADHLEAGARGDPVEVGVVVQHGHGVAESHGGDEAVDPGSRREALLATTPVDRGGLLPVVAGPYAEVVACV
jgi:hypothetical protein